MPRSNDLSAAAGNHTSCRAHDHAEGARSVRHPGQIRNADMRLCHGNSVKHAWRAGARDASWHSNDILPLCSGFGSEDPKGGSRDEVALKVEGVVDRTMHVEEALGGSS